MPARSVHHGDGRAWLAANPLPRGHALVTSLPDRSELPELDFLAWRSWFVDTAEQCCRSVADDGVVVFYQSDVKHDGRWVDKGFLVSLGAERAGSACLWHKIVCRAPAGSTSFGRPAYAHMLCFSRERRLPAPLASPDVLPGLGAMTWSRAMGLAACRAIAAFLAKLPDVTTVVDPFCGLGTMLAVANEAGLDAVGVELSRKRASKAQRLSVSDGTAIAPED